MTFPARYLNRFWLTAWIIILLGVILPAPVVRAQQDAPLVITLQAEGALTPAMHEYLQRGIQIAEQRQAELIIFQLDTPGGEIQLMTRMIQTIRSSPVPVVVYVAPRGAMAASAGTLITLAGHAAAMAPETTIGAASPIGGAGEDLGETAAAKIKNDMRAMVRGLAAHRSPEAIEFAESTIESAEAATASEALEIGLVDFIARDLDDLLAQLDGFTVRLQDEEHVLRTANAQVEAVTLSPIEQLLSVLTNPNIVFLLITVGVQAILIEISSPGGWVAGFIGVVCLALATYGLGVLPVNWFGVIFLITAFVLFIMDIKAPTHGALTAAGVASLIVGALVLFNSPGAPDFQRVSVPLVVTSSSFTGAMFFVILLFALRAQKEPVRMGQESLIGRVGTVQVDLNPTGIVQLAGEQWTAQVEDGHEPLARGTRVRVLRLAGLKLIVSKADSGDPSA